MGVEGNAVPARVLSLTPIHTHRKSRRVVASLLVAFLDLESKGFIIGNFCGEWNSDNMEKGGMNGLANWPHFYFNVGSRNGGRTKLNTFAAD